MFKRIETDEALIYERGVFKIAEVYEGPDGGLYVKAKGGFLRVKRNGATSHDAVKLERLYREGALYADSFDRLSVSSAKGRKPVFLAPPSPEAPLRITSEGG